MMIVFSLSCGNVPNFSFGEAGKFKSIQIHESCYTPTRQTRVRLNSLETGVKKREGRPG